MNSGVFFRVVLTHFMKKVLFYGSSGYYYGSSGVILREQWTLLWKKWSYFTGAVDTILGIVELFYWSSETI
jgi:hypothetical protein